MRDEGQQSRYDGVAQPVAEPPPHDDHAVGDRLRRLPLRPHDGDAGSELGRHDSARGPTRRGSRDAPAPRLPRQPGPVPPRGGDGRADAAGRGQPAGHPRRGAHHRLQHAVDRAREHRRRLPRRLPGERGRGDPVAPRSGHRRRVLPDVERPRDHPGRTARLEPRRRARVEGGLHPHRQGRRDRERVGAGVGHHRDRLAERRWRHLPAAPRHRAGADRLRAGRSDPGGRVRRRSARHGPRRGGFSRAGRRPASPCCRGTSCSRTWPCSSP